MLKFYVVEIPREAVMGGRGIPDAVRYAVIQRGMLSPISVHNTHRVAQARCDRLNRVSTKRS